MKVSMTLPSLQPVMLDRCLRSIFATVPASLDFEIIIVAPYEVTGPHIKWIPEDTPRGNCYAHQVAWLHSTGDYIVTLSDDYIFDAPWLEKALDRIIEKEKSHFPFSVGLHQGGDVVGTVFGIYYPYFPVMSRRTIETIGGYFSTDYIAHFGDVDMALRIWAAGGRCEVCLDTRIIGLIHTEQMPETKLRSLAQMQDLDTFLKRWKPFYGVGWRSDTLRDFNLDIPSQLFPHVMKDNSVFVNNPAFRKLVFEAYDLIGYTKHKEW